MKISKDQKKKNFALLLKAAARLSQKKDFAELTMRAIASEAKMSEAAIYNYFPTKESLLTGYLHWSISEALEKVKSHPSFLGMNFSERLHLVIESHLELIEVDRDFVKQVYGHLFVQSIPFAQSSLKETRKLYMDFVDREMEEAVGRNEMTEPPFRGLLCELFWDFHVGVIYYWLKDESRGSINTTQVIDLSLNIFNELMRGGLMNKVYQLGHFLLKEHVLNKLFTLGKTE